MPMRSIITIVLLASLLILPILSQINRQIFKVKITTYNKGLKLAWLCTLGFIYKKKNNLSLRQFNQLAGF